MTPDKKVFYRDANGKPWVREPSLAWLIRLQHGRPDYDPAEDMQRLRATGVFTQAELALLVKPPLIEVRRRKAALESELAALQERCLERGEDQAANTAIGDVQAQIAGAERALKEAEALMQHERAKCEGNTAAFAASDPHARHGRDPGSVPGYLVFQWAAIEGGKTLDEALALIIAKDCHGASDIAIFDGHEVPNGKSHRHRRFHDAMVLRGGKVEFDMARCRDLDRQQRRLARASKLVALDVQQLRGMNVEAQKQELRDVTADPAIEVAQTPDDLHACWPKCLE